MRRLSAAVIVISFIALTGQPADAAASVSIANFRFTPGTVTVAQGGSISWHNAVGGLYPSDHTSTQNTPLGLWNTGHIAPGATSASMQLLAAGTYPYHCNIHRYMHGVIRVPVVVTPARGNRMTNFTVHLASSRQAGFTYDVQRKVGTGAWTTWKTGVASTSVRFRHTPGTLWFRSRLHKVANGATSGWSPAARITIG